jgi:hypothetical protein
MKLASALTFHRALVPFSRSNYILSMAIAAALTWQLSGSR